MKTLCMTEPLSQKMGTWAQITFLSVHDRGSFSDDGDLGTDCIPLCAWQRHCLRRWGPGHTLHSSLGLGTCKEQMKRRRHSFPRYKHKGWIQSAAADPECQPVAYRSHPRKPAAFLKSDLWGDQTRLQQLLHTTTPVTHPLQISWIWITDKFPQFYSHLQFRSY